MSPPESVVWDVARLLQAVADSLQQRFGAVAVRGELGQFTRASSGHCYFTLKAADGSAALRCAMFRRAASLLDFAPAEGQAVELRGRLAVYEPRGELQFIVEAMRRAGAGALMEQFLRLKARLEAEGLFAPERKRALPAWPRRLGIVTSLSGAVLHDVATTLARRAPQVELVVYPASVQGLQAPGELCAALELANRRAEVEALLVCRGGGSLEDLWAFNDERVVRAIAASRLPVVSGVGHETDVTLADFAADLRAPTPTAAAELAAPAREAALAQLGVLAQSLQQRLHRRLDREAQRLDHAALRLARPGDALHRQRRTLDALAQRLSLGPPQRVQAQRERLQRQAWRLQAAQQTGRQQARQTLALLAARLQAVDPQQVLARGYAWLCDAQGRTVSSVGALAPGDALQATLRDGDVQATVRAVQPRMAE